MTDESPAGGERTAADERRASLVAVATAGGKFAIVAQDFEQVWRLSTVFASSGDMVPKSYRDNPSACAMAIMWGMELGISPIQSIQGIAVIGGKPSVWGDLMLAICQSSPAFVDLHEIELHDEAGKYLGARAIAKRKGRDDVARDFTMQMAQDAGLTAKSNTPWQLKGYQPRMCQMRARSWALRDQFADALRGIGSADEMRDVDAIEGEFTAAPATSQRDRAAQPMRQPQAKAPATQPAAAQTSLPSPEPDLLGQLAGKQVAAAAAETVTVEQTDHAEPAAAKGSAAPQGQPSGVDFSDLETPADLAPLATRKPLTKGDERMVRAYLDTASPYGVTEQDLIDELGDSVHKGNLERALAWLQQKCTDAKG